MQLPEIVRVKCGVYQNLYNTFVSENKINRTGVIRLVGIISLILVLIIQSISTSLTLFNFEIQREAITALFCINKEKPEMHCEGKCYLEKQIKADEESHSEKPQSRVEFIVLVFTLASCETEFLTQFTTQVTHNFKYIIPHHSSKVFTIFHPPQA